MDESTEWGDKLKITDGDRITIADVDRMTRNHLFFRESVQESMARASLECLGGYRGRVPSWRERMVGRVTLAWSALLGRTTWSDIG